VFLIYVVDFLIVAAFDSSVLSMQINLVVVVVVEINPLCQHKTRNITFCIKQSVHEVK
jgi:hypothetical protein